MNDTQRNHLRTTPAKRKGSTPEAKVTAALDRYLTSIDVLSIRANAGSWSDERGHVIMGAKAGTSDKLLCIGGYFVALEIKSATGKQSEAQQRFQARVEALGGVYIKASSVDELRAGLCQAYGLQRVAEWEAEGRARVTAKKQRVEDLKRKMGQIK